MPKLLTVPGLLLVLILTYGCAPTIVPKPLGSADKVNPVDRSITVNHPSLTLSARVQDPAVGGYSMTTPIASFYIVVSNKSGKPLAFPLAAFTLIDSRGSKHPAIKPDTVNLLLQPEYDYLVPFPFVSYLDVTGEAMQRSVNAMASEQPYLGSGLPVESAGDPLPSAPVPSGGRGSGVVFFEIDLEAQNSFRLQVTDPLNSSSFVFPFVVEK